MKITYALNSNIGGFFMRKYGCLSFITDCVLVLATGGLWLIWIFVREMRRK